MNNILLCKVREWTTYTQHNTTTYLTFHAITSRSPSRYALFTIWEFRHVKSWVCILCYPYSPEWEQSYPMKIHPIHKYFGLWVCFVAPSHTSSWHSSKRNCMCIFMTTKDNNRDDDDNSITIHLGENFLKVFFCFWKKIPVEINVYEMTPLPNIRSENEMLNFFSPSCFCAY